MSRNGTSCGGIGGLVAQPIRQRHSATFCIGAGGATVRTRVPPSAEAGTGRRQQPLMFGLQRPAAGPLDLRSCLRLGSWTWTWTWTPVDPPRCCRPPQLCRSSWCHTFGDPSSVYMYRRLEDLCSCPQHALPVYLACFREKGETGRHRVASTCRSVGPETH